VVQLNVVADASAKRARRIVNDFEAHGSCYRSSDAAGDVPSGRQHVVGSLPGSRRETPAPSYLAVIPCSNTRRRPNRTTER
jgi:hypothetical protein